MDKQGQGTALRCVLCLGYNLPTCGYHLRHRQGVARQEAERQPLVLEGCRGGYTWDICGEYYILFMVIFQHGAASCILEIFLMK